MIGTAKLSTIREKLRKALKLTDAELLAWFNERAMSNSKAKSKKQPRKTLNMRRCVCSGSCLFCETSVSEISGIDK